MATHTSAVKSAMADAAVDLVDVGTTDATGDLVFLTAGDVVVATLALSNPSFGAAVAGVATANAITADSSAVGGTIAKFILQDRDNTEVVRGTCSLAAGGGEMELSSLVITATEEVRVDSLDYTVPN